MNTHNTDSDRRFCLDLFFSDPCLIGVYPWLILSVNSFSSTPHDKLKFVGH